MEKVSTIYVAGDETVIGSAIRRRLAAEGYPHVAGVEAGPDLTDSAQVDAFFAVTAPDYVFLAAGRSGGIGANQKYPADLLRENLLVECNVIDSAHRHRVRKLLFIASSCVYPRDCPQPMRVASLLDGPLEPTSEAYALAKLAGIKLCQAYRRQYGARFIAGVAADVFGPGDDFSAEDSHVIPALIRKMHEAKTLGREYVEIWGSGAPRRQFIFADDLAEACILVLREYDEPEPINIGNGSELSIRDIALLIREVTGYRGELRFDTSKPDGMPRKTLDCSRLQQMGWKPAISLRASLAATYESFLQREKRKAGAGNLTGGTA